MENYIECINCGSPRKLNDHLFVEECSVCHDDEYDNDNYDRQEEYFLEQCEGLNEFEVL